MKEERHKPFWGRSRVRVYSCQEKGGFHCWLIDDGWRMSDGFDILERPQSQA